MAMILVSSAPPQTTISQINTATGIIIAYPKYDTLALDEEFILKINVFNATMSSLTNDTTTCYFHLYNGNPRGATAYEDIANYTFDIGGGMFEWDIPAEFFNTTGEYAYNIKCNSSNEVGYVNSIYRVTPTGEDLNTPQAILYIGYLFAMGGMFLLFLYGSLAFEWDNKRDEKGNIIEINVKKYFKILSIYLVYISMIFFTGTMNSIFSFFLYHNNAGSFFNYIYTLLFAGIYPSIIVLMLVVLLTFLNDKKISKGIDAWIREFGG